MCIQYIILGIAPFLINASRLNDESLAILPIAHIACYTIPGCYDFTNFINNYIAPLFIIDWHCCGLPLATFASAHVAYNCNWGYYYWIISYINLGITPESIIAWIGG